VTLYPEITAAFLARESEAARRMLLDLTPPAPQTIPYGEIWPQVLSRHAVRKADLNSMAAVMRKDRRLLFPGWPDGKRVPGDGFRLSRPA